MILFLCGKDTFRSQKKLSEIISSYRSKYKSGLNFLKIEASEEGFEELKERVETVSMFKEKKMIILKNTLSSAKNLQEKLEKCIKEKKLFESKDIILIFFEEKEFKKLGSLYKTILKRAFKKQEFEELPFGKIKDFIKKNYRMEIENRALDKLIEFCGNNLWQLDREIKKLTAFKNGDTVEEEDIEKLCEADFNPNIFETIESISKKNKRRALELLLRHLEKGENEMKLLTMIIYQFRNIIMIKSLIEEKKRQTSTYYQFKNIGIHPFVIRKTIPIAKNFTMGELKNIYQKLLELDFGIKTGKIEPKIGIEMFVMEL